MIETLRTWRLLRDLRRGDNGRDPLTAAVCHAYDRVPFYRRRWNEAGFDPGSVRGPQDLHRIPRLPNDVARASLERGELMAQGGAGKDLRAFPTSGSSGHPLWVPRGRAEQRRWRAGALRIWFEHGYRWTHATAHLDSHSGPPHPLHRLGLARTVWISPELPLEEQVDRLARTRPDIVVGTPTVLRRLARAIESGGRAGITPRIIFCQGEVVDAATSRQLRRTFGTAPVGLYGTTELGYLAWQCECRDSYHVNDGACVVEILRDGRPARPGELGSVVVTDLRARTTPLLRYETGDLALAAAGPCPCGRPSPLVGTIEGRAADLIRLADGRLLTPRTVSDHMAAMLAPDRYRLCQEELGRFALHLEGNAPHPVVAHLRRLLGEVEVNVIPGVPAGAGRDKSRPVVSRLTPPHPRPPGEPRDGPGP